MSEISNNKNWKDVLFQSDSLHNELEEPLKSARENYMEIYNDGSYLNLPREKLRKILKSDELNVENEEVVFESVKRWLEHNHENFSEHLKPLLKAVRLHLLPYKYLFEQVEPFVYQYKDGRDVFINALRNRILGENKSKKAARKYQKIIPEKNTAYSDPENTSTRLISIGSDNLYTANVVEIYDDDIHRWIKPNKLNLARINYSVAMIEDKVILIGGSASFDENTETLKTVQSLDISTGLLTSEEPLNVARQNSATIVFGEGKGALLYVLGGRGIYDDLDSVERWDPLTGTWSLMQAMPSRRAGLAAAVLNGQIYILGGRIDDQYTNTMEAYKPGNSRWEKKASMKEARAHFCVAVFKNMLYAVAGAAGKETFLQTIEKYNHFDDSWVTIANIPSAGHVGICSLGNRLVCAGGNQSSDAFEYDEKVDKWSNIEGLSEPRAGYLLQLPKAMNDIKFIWPKHEEDFPRFLMIGKQELNKTTLVKEYDARKNQWIHYKDLELGKSNYCVTVINDDVLIIGGYSSNGVHSNEVDSIDLCTGKVSQLSPLNYRRQHSAAVALSQGILKTIFVFGGVKDDYFLNSVEKWDSSHRTWKMVTPMRVGRAGHGVVLFQNKIYVVGGKTGKDTYDNTVEAYDFENDHWTTKASMKNAKAYFGITTTKYFIYVAGGYINDATPVNSVERYDPADDTWITIANISSTGTVGLSGTGNMMICAGGKSSNLVEEYVGSEKAWRKLKSDGLNFEGIFIQLKPDVDIYSKNWIDQRRKNSNRLIFLSQYQKTDNENIETFDVEHKKWTKHKDFPLQLGHFSPIIISNKLLLIGGYDNGNRTSVNSVRAIDLSSGTFQTFPDLTHSRRSAASAIFTEGNKTVLYVFGGSDSNNNGMSSVEKWDSSTNKWSKSVSMTYSRYAHSCVFLHGKIYVLGGYTFHPNGQKSMESFDVKNEEWQTKAPMNFPRVYFGIAVYNDHIYVTGGFGVPTVERYDPHTDVWTQLAGIQSRLRVGLCALGDRLICAGGEKNTVEEYDVVGNRWIPLPSMTTKKPHEGFLLELPENAVLEN